MRHSKARYQLNRFSSWRKATVISLAKSLLKYEQIQTTLVRAKSARPLVENIIADAKTNTLANKRRAFAVLGEHRLVNTVYTEIAPRFKDINGGFTRILKLGKRRGDNAEMVLFELTKKKEKKVKPKAEKAAHEQRGEHAAEAEPVTEKTPEKKTAAAVQERPAAQKPQKKFLGGIRKIFKKERDSL
jgi:large subunit ribosomal protein L17